MKSILGVFMVFLLVSCSPDAKLVKENRRLKKLAEEQQELAMKSAAEARMAQAQVVKAAEEANMQKLAAEKSAEEAIRQKKAAEEALRRLKDCQ